MPPPPKKGVFRNPTFAVPVVSIALLSGFFLAYYARSTSQQEARLNKRAFRSLAAASDQFQSCVRNYVTALSHAGTRAKEEEEGKGESGNRKTEEQVQESVKKYLQEQLPDLTYIQMSQPSDWRKDAVSAREEPKARSRATGEAGDQAARKQRGTGTAPVDEGPSSKAARSGARKTADQRSQVPDATDSPQVTVRPEPVNGSYWLEFGSSKTWAAGAPIEKLITPFLQGSPDQISTPDQIFDDVLLTKLDGAVLYQTSKTGARINNLASVLPIAAKDLRPESENKAEPANSRDAAVLALIQRLNNASLESRSVFPRAAQASTLALAPIAGTDYKVFLVPVALLVKPSNSTERPDVAQATGKEKKGGRISESGNAIEANSKGQTGASAEEPLTLVLCGLLSNSRFRDEGLKPPETVLIGVLLVLPVFMVGAWPLLKLGYMRATERIPRNFGLYFFLSALATTLLISMLAFHIRHSSDESNIDNNLHALASVIERNLAQELKHALRVMDAAGHSKAFEEDRNYLKDPSPGTKQYKTRTNLLSEEGLQLNYYPYLDAIVWLDTQGKAVIKWEIAEVSTPNANFSDRPYFRSMKRGDLWYLSTKRSDEARFRVDPVFSIFTGEYLAIISQRVSERERFRLPSGSDLAIKVMPTPLLSLIHPVLPPDYGFAMIDEKGKVLFHSAPAKNDRENFFDEVEDSAQLEAVVQSGEHRHLNIQYLGFDHRILAQPLTSIRECPWSLIVFHNGVAGVARHVNRMLLLSYLVGIYYISIVILAFLGNWLLVRRRRFPPVWIWPRKAMSGTYVYLTMFLLLLVPVSYLRVFDEKATFSAVLITVIAIALLSIAVVVLKLVTWDWLITWCALVLIVAQVFLPVLLRQERQVVELGLWIAIIVLLLWPGQWSTKFERLTLPSFENMFTLVGVLRWTPKSRQLRART